MWLTLLILLSLVGLWKGSDWVIVSGKSLGKRLGLSEMLIGLTVISIGSSLPEIFIATTVALRQVDGIQDLTPVAIGNIVGNCMIQITLVVGIVTLIVGKLTIPKKTLYRDGILLIAVIVFDYLLALDGQVSRVEGVIMMLLYLLYVYYLIAQGSYEKNHVGMEEEIRRRHEKHGKWKVAHDVFFVLVGTLVVYFSARTLIDAGVQGGRLIGISESMVGLLSGFGTSLPEFVISLIAIFRKSMGISVGNLIGSNITDPLFSFGIGASIAHYHIDPHFLILEIPFWLGGTVLMFLLFAHRLELNRVKGAILVLFYLVFFLIKLQSGT